MHKNKFIYELHNKFIMLTNPHFKIQNIHIDMTSIQKNNGQSTSLTTTKSNKPSWPSPPNHAPSHPLLIIGSTYVHPAPTLQSQVATSRSFDLRFKGTICSEVQLTARVTIELFSPIIVTHLAGSGRLWVHIGALLT